MTLEQAKEQHDDALEIKFKHKAYIMTEDRMNYFGKRLRGGEYPSKVLFISIGKYTSRVISSRQAYLDEQKTNCNRQGGY
jgi:uncharacterized DUF497 family protein